MIILGWCCQISFDLFIVVWVYIADLCRTGHLASSLVFVVPNIANRLNRFHKSYDFLKFVVLLYNFSKIYEHLVSNATDEILSLSCITQACKKILSD